jgi:crotonobetainyl-CoA:carnitine CoA-transferase CaiB-like acyl-CoA transferase
MYLADLGADVIKIENPQGGDVSRATGPYFHGASDSQFFQTFNLNKRSLTLDLKHADGQKIFQDLIRGADAVMNNLRGDQPAKLGLNYAALSAINEKIVCAHLSAYGRGGPREAWPGYDYLMQAEAGFLQLTGEPDAPPARFGLSMVDYMTGITTALALVSAVLGARQFGIGRDVDVALFDVALHQLSYPATWYLNAQHQTKRLPRSAHPTTVPCQLVKTADGWVFVMAMLDKFWQQLCQGIDRKAWLTDPRFADVAARRENRFLLSDLLDQAMSAQTTSHWCQRFAGEIPLAPVYDLQQALDNPYVLDVNLLQTVEHPNGALRMLRNPIRLDNERISAHAAPAIGQHSELILAELGYSAEQIQQWRAAGTI